uniref:Uncharacterized protein n=1 Tax=Strombidium rassoulzadegani TaxID=1082188 RepID=A0A7S3FXX1_9SPIT|mmetsp:Transcript_8561/g.14442  ORF Transcript_8561/g.14442 Transcript_8561/m.14442 type:complete len:133 (+) Transcript_8561:771-1169(+)
MSLSKSEAERQTRRLGVFRLSFFYLLGLGLEMYLAKDIPIMMRQHHQRYMAQLSDRQLDDLLRTGNYNLVVNGQLYNQPPATIQNAPAFMPGPNSQPPLPLPQAQSMSPAPQSYASPLPNFQETEFVQNKKL